MTEYLEEQNGKPSSMRLMSLISLLASIGCAAITLTRGEATGTNGLFLTGMFLIGAFCPKYLQKFLESKIPTTEPKK